MLVRIFELFRTEGIVHTAITLPSRARRWLAWRVRRRYHDWVDGSIDRKYRIDTGGYSDRLREAGASGEHLTHGYGYEAVKLEVWREIVRCLDIDTRKFTFVDLGSGKGRALILASLQGYKKVIGVEFARDFYTTSIDNLDQFRKRTPSAPPVEILCQDAATFRFPDAKLVLFLFNPFDDTVLAKVVENLEESLRNVPRRAIVIYRNPVHSAVLLQSSLTLVKTVRMYSASKISFEIYTNGQDR